MSRITPDRQARACFAFKLFDDASNLEIRGQAISDNIVARKAARTG